MSNTLFNWNTQVEASKPNFLLYSCNKGFQIFWHGVVVETVKLTVNLLFKSSTFKISPSILMISPIK